MKSKIIFSLAVSAALLASGCGYNTYNNAPYSAPVAYTPAQAKIDAKILGGIITLNQNEMAAAAEAQRKATNPAVKNYANWMYREHSQNLQTTEALSQKLGITPIKGNLALMLQKKGRNELAMLQRLNGPAFDKAYMDSMVKDHSAALQMLNKKLIPMAVNPMLKRHLEATRDHVMQHLQQAKSILR